MFFLYHVGVKKNWKVIKKTKKQKQKAWKPSSVHVCLRSLTSGPAFRSANFCFSSLLLPTLWLRGGPGHWDAAPLDGAMGAELISTSGRSCFCPVSRPSSTLHPHPTFLSQTLNSHSHTWLVARCSQMLLLLWLLKYVGCNSLYRNGMHPASYYLQVYAFINRGGISTGILGGGESVGEFLLCPALILTPLPSIDVNQRENVAHVYQRCNIIPLMVSR